MTTVKFNVGGKDFVISREFVYKSEKLTALSEYHFSDEAIFLDHNYAAFSVVLDFLRYGKILLPPTVNAQGVEIILDDLKIAIYADERAALLTPSKHAGEDNFPDGPPQYKQIVHEDNQRISLADTKKSSISDTSNLTAQLAVTVQQKITDLIITTIRPRITSQALQGAYRSTYILLPVTAQKAVMMSEFPQSNFTEMVYLEPDEERFLLQKEVLDQFEYTLKQSLEIPITMGQRELFFRIENEFGVYGTMTSKALVIEFELGQGL